MTTPLTWLDVDRAFGPEASVFFDRDIAPQGWPATLRLRERDQRLGIDLKYVDGIRYAGQALWAEDDRGGDGAAWTGESWIARSEVAARIAGHDSLVTELCQRYDWLDATFMEEMTLKPSPRRMAIVPKRECGHLSRISVGDPLPFGQVAAGAILRRAIGRDECRDPRCDLMRRNRELLGDLFRNPFQAPTSRDRR